MKYEEALKIIIQKQSLGIKPGLTRIYALLDAMGNPQDKLKIVHIAGTNGKGTVAYTIAQNLIDNGYKVGLFTSPWVDDYREQIQINNEYISKSDLASYIEKYKDCDATEFELITAIMYKYFYDSGVDYAVVECGMGGKGDATNVEKSNLSVITSISLDHTDFLGDTVEKIAYEKAGIIKENSVCVLYPNPSVEHIFEEVCRQKNTRLFKVDKGDDYIEDNFITAVSAIFELGINIPAVMRFPPARMECINDVFIDGGHNVEAAKALLNTPPYLDNMTAVIGMMADKDNEGYLKIIAPHCKSIVTTTPHNSRALPAKMLKAIAKKYCNDVIAIDDPLNAIAVAREKGLDLVCGSFYLAREVRKELLR